jgi:hypothetical protein
VQRSQLFSARLRRCFVSTWYVRPRGWSLEPWPTRSSPHPRSDDQYGLPWRCCPCAVLGMMIEGTVQTLVEHIPKERRRKFAATLKQSLEERIRASGVRDTDG